LTPLVLDDLDRIAECVPLFFPSFLISLRARNAGFKLPKKTWGLGLPCRPRLPRSPELIKFIDNGTPAEITPENGSITSIKMGAVRRGGRRGILTASVKIVMGFDTGEVLIYLRVKAFIIILMNPVVVIENRIEIAVVPIIQIDFVIEFRTMGYGCSLN